MPVKPSTDPTDKSICRQTMTRTMPVAMMPTTLDCTAKLYIFLAVKKMPWVMISSTTQMTTSARIMASMRWSISAGLGMGSLRNE